MSSCRSCASSPLPSEGEEEGEGEGEDDGDGSAVASLVSDFFLAMNRSEALKQCRGERCERLHLCHALHLLPRVIAGTHERARLNMAEAERMSDVTQLTEFVG